MKLKLQNKYGYWQESQCSGLVFKRSENTVFTDCRIMDTKYKGCNVEGIDPNGNRCLFNGQYAENTD